jgi:hypothetical protein
MLHDRHFLVFQRFEDRVLQPPVEIVQHRALIVRNNAAPDLA